MTVVFKQDVMTNLIESLNKSCKKFKFGDEEEEYFCPCGYLKTMMVKRDEGKELEVKSPTCGF